MFSRASLNQSTPTHASPLLQTRAEDLVEALDTELRGSTSTAATGGATGRWRRPLLVFRRGVLVVIAANRLAALGRGSGRLFSTYCASLGGPELSVACRAQREAESFVGK